MNVNRAGAAVARLLLALMLCVLVLAMPAPAAYAQPATAAKIAPALQARLATLPPDATIKVIVTFVEQADLAHAAHDGATGAAAAGDPIIHALQATSARTQTRFAARLSVQGAGADGLAVIEAIEYFWVFNGAAVTATPAAIQALAAMPEVRWLAPDAIDLAPAQGTGAVEPNLAATNVPALWAEGWQGQGVVVASLDTGVDGSHPALADRWRGGSNSWFDPYGDHPQFPYDHSGHGTWTMGVMVGSGGEGAAFGIAPQARWIAAKIFDDRGRSTATAVHRSFQWLLDPDGNPATADAPQVVNNSWTFATPGCDLAFALDLRALRAAGILPIFAAGNAGPQHNTSMSPANNSGALSVGATDNGAGLYPGSSRGPAACGEAESTYPDLSAPGADIRSSDRYGSYTVATGTSLAAPHVAGGLALLLSAFGDLPVTRQEAALLNGARDLGAPGPDQDFGHGRLDTAAAYAWLVEQGFAPRTTAIVVTTTQDGVVDDQACGLREAILAANSDNSVGGCTAGSGADTIRFGASLPRPATFVLTAAGTDEDGGLTGDLDVTGTLMISDSVPAAVTAGADQATAAAQVIIDGNDSDRVLHVLPGARLSLAGIMLRNGSVPMADDGGGVKVAGTLTLERTWVTANAGGGVANDGGSLHFDAASIEANVGGYGITNSNLGALTMRGGAIVDNQGGGLFNSRSQATLDGVTVAGNSGSGGIVNSGQALTRLVLQGSAVISNSGTSGGGLANLGIGATATVAQSRIAYNQASSAGGGIYNSGSLAVEASTVDHNVAPAGGGVYHAGSTLGLTQVTVSSNTAADNGGGLYNRASTTAHFVTFSDNQAAGDGDAIFDDEAQLSIGASIVAGIPGGDTCANSAGTVTSLGYNVESTATCGLAATDDLAGVDARLGALLENGGAIPLNLPADDSPAVERVPAGVLGCGKEVTLDPRGIGRPAGANCDAGAVEVADYADLAIEIAASPYTLGASRRLTFTLTAANLGPADASAVTMTAALPAGVQLIQASGPDGACNGTVAGLIACSIAQLAAGGQAGALLVTSAPTRTGTLTVTATISATTPDLQPANNRAGITLGQVTRIDQIQGAAHVSPRLGQAVVTRGIVTQRQPDGFYLQDVVGDGNPATSEGIYIEDGGQATVAVGDLVGVVGRVAELPPEAATPFSLSRTALVEPVVSVESSGHLLPTPATWGAADRLPPAAIIDDDGLATFEPASDGLDFAESLEAMRVQVVDAVVVGPQGTAGSTWVVGDGGSHAGPRTARGGLYATPADLNPERLQVRGALDAGVALPSTGVGARFAAPLVGIFDQRAAAYELLVTSPVTVDVSGQALPAVASLAGDDHHLTIAAIDVAGVGGDATEARVGDFAGGIVANLGSPDILLVQGMGDDSGAADDGVVTAQQNFARLIGAIQQAGGPAYALAQIDPVDNHDGGPPGANLRLGILYNPVRAGLGANPGTATTENAVQCNAGVAHLAYNPGRIGTASPAFGQSPRPLAAEFSVGGEPLFVIGIKLIDATADAPLYGNEQPPLHRSEAQRIAQAEVVQAFAAALLACDPTTRVVVLGTLGDHPASPSMAALQGTLLTDLAAALPEEVRYSQIIDGNSQMLEAMLVSAALAPDAALELVHLYAEVAGAPGRRDPILAQLRMDVSTFASHLFLPQISRSQ